jgi:addiction module HigA family antidote
MIRIPTNREPTHPGEMLVEEFLVPMKITQRELANAIHVPYQRVNELVNKKRGVTPSTALRLARFFGVSPDFWLNLQARWDLHRAQEKEQEELDAIKDFRHLKKRPQDVGADSSAIKNESWILTQPPTHYTIQVIALSSKAKVESLIEGFETLAPFATYTVQTNTKPIHILIQGDYLTVDAARTARDAFPHEISPPNRVWIRQFEMIQQLIRLEQ